MEATSVSPDRYINWQGVRDLQYALQMVTEADSLPWQLTTFGRRSVSPSVPLSR